MTKRNPTLSLLTGGRKTNPLPIKTLPTPKPLFHPGTCHMTYKREKPASRQKGLQSSAASSSPDEVKVLLEPGTLQVLTGASRYGEKSEEELTMFNCLLCFFFFFSFL